MKITYDTATDTLTVVLRDAPARISEEEKSGVILNYDADDRLIAMGERLFPIRHAALSGRIPIVIAPAAAEGAAPGGRRREPRSAR